MHSFTVSAYQGSNSTVGGLAADSFALNLYIGMSVVLFREERQIAERKNSQTPGTDSHH